jgi:hypothetical protein
LKVLAWWGWLHLDEADWMQGNLVAVVQSFMHCGAIVVLASAMREGEASVVADRLVSEITGQGE